MKQSQLGVGFCNEANHASKAKRLVRAFENATLRLSQAERSVWAMDNVYDEMQLKHCKAAYKRTRNNLLNFMGV